MTNEVWVERNGVRTCVYKPEPKQRAFHESTRYAQLTAGGRGSGKSMAMRWDAYMCCLAIPRFRALIVRRQMPELKQSHLNYVPYEVHQLGLDPKAWHATDFVVRFPNGSTLRFGHVENDESLTKYLSSEYERIYFDELATFTLRQFVFLCTSLRSPIKGYKPCVRAGTNPVGPGASWVKRFFIDKNPSKEEAPEYDPEDYDVIYANLEDNSHVDQEAYAKILNAVPSEALRKALRYGEWTIEGQAFGEWRETDDEGRPWHVWDRGPTYKGKPIATVERVVRIVDWGYAATGNPGMCLWFVLLPDGRALGFQEYVFKETLPKLVAKEILRRSRGMTIAYTVGDTAMWQEHEGPSIAELFAREGLSMIEADKARIPGWVQVHIWLRELVTLPDGRAVPKLCFLREGCPTTIRTIPQMLVDPKDPNDIVTTGVEDEGADCTRYFVMSRPSARRETVPLDPAVAWAMKEIRKRTRASRSLRVGPEATRRVAA